MLTVALLYGFCYGALKVSEDASNGRIVVRMVNRNVQETVATFRLFLGELGAPSHPRALLHLLRSAGGRVVPPESAKRRPLCPHVSARHHSPLVRAMDKSIGTGAAFLQTGSE